MKVVLHTLLRSPCFFSNPRLIDSDMMAVFDVNDTISALGNGDAFSDPMDPRYRARPYTGRNLTHVEKVLLPAISAMNVYPKHVVEQAAMFLGGGVLNMETVMEETEAAKENVVPEIGSKAGGIFEIMSTLLSVRRPRRRSTGIGE